MEKRFSMFIASLLLLTLFRLADSSPHSRRIHHDCESGHPADVIFVLDASNSIWRPDFQRQIDFVKEISGMFRIGPNNTRVAVITYAAFPQFQFHLNDYSAKADILAAMDGVRQMGGYHTSTPDAIRAMRERGFRVDGGRANVTRVGIVITDGRSDDPVKTEAEARRARHAGIHLFAVGVGLDLDLQELEKIASSPSRYYTFTVESYSGLENIKDLLAIKACTVTDPPTTTTTTVTTTHTTPKTTTAEVNEDDSHRESDRHGTTTDEMESKENRGHGQHDGKSTGGGKVSSEDEDNKESDDNGRDHYGGNYGKSGHEDDVEQERPIRRQRINKTNEDGDSGNAPGWTDATQNGDWSYDKHGNTTRIVHGSKESGSEEDGRSNKTQAVDGYDMSGYQVLPVDSHSKKNHSSNKKTAKSDSKAKNRTASNELSVCRPNAPLDVVFVVDSKSGDRRGDRRMLEAIRQVVEQVDMDDGQMRVQFVHSCSGRTDHRISDRSPIAKSLPVDDPADLRGSSAPRQTSDLFETMTSKLTVNGKPGRKRVGVYLTNGPSNGDLERTLEAVQEAKGTHGVEMFTVGLGKDVNPTELRAIASCEVARHAFTLRHQNHHSRSKEILKHLAQSLCSLRL